MLRKPAGALLIKDLFILVQTLPRLLFPIATDNEVSCGEDYRLVYAKHVIDIIEG